MRRAMSIFLGILLGLALLFVGFAVWVRIAPSPAATWHVADPASFPDPSTPNFARADRLVQMPLSEVVSFINAQATSDGATLLAGSETNGTWLTRTRVMGYPDYVSVKLTAVNESETRMEVLSRSRFGYGDMGANRARLRRWLPVE